MKTSIVHDWLVTMGGAEKVLDEIYQMYPSDIYTLVCDKEKIKKMSFFDANICSSIISKLPKAIKKYREYLSFFPFAVDSMDMSNYDVILSSSHAVVKNVLTSPDQLHICYINNIMLYVWDHFGHYMNKGIKNKFKRFFAKFIIHYVRTWDAIAGCRPDYYIANSNYMAKRIKKYYGKDSTVIYPPVELDKFRPSEKKENYYILISRLVPFKRVEIVVQAFNSMPDKKLLIIGDGPEMKNLKSTSNNNIEYLGFVSHDKVVNYLAKAKAFVFASEEPFGIAYVEAQACVTPVIAFERGGASEIILNEKQGVLYKEQSSESLISAIQCFEQNEKLLDSESMLANAKRFSKERFKKEYKSFVEEKKKEFFR